MDSKTKKTNRFQFRFEDEIVDWFEKNSKELGVTKTELIRRLIKTQNLKTKTSKTEINLLKSLIFQVTKTGVNLNQISHYFHVKNKVGKNPLNKKEQLILLKSELENLKKEQRKIIDLVFSFIEKTTGQK